MRVRIAESTQGYAAPPEWIFRGEKFVLGCLDCFSDRARTPERGVGADRGDAVFLPGFRQAVTPPPAP
jgi:hypothetical protein